MSHEDRQPHPSPRPRVDVGGLGEDEVRRLAEELQTSRIELEVQNEELRAAQSDLQRSRDLYSRLFHEAPVGYLTLDPDGVVLEANETFARMTGRERAGIAGRAVASFVAPPDRPVFLARWKAFARRPDDKSIELRLTRRDGNLFHALLEGRWDVRPDVADPAGRPPRLLLTVRNVTRERTAEAALQASEEEFRRLYQQFRALLDALPEELALYDRDLQLVWANAAAATAIGPSDADAPGETAPTPRTGAAAVGGATERRRAAPLCTAETPEACPVRQTFASGDAARLEFTDPSDRCLEVRTVPLRDDRGAVFQVIEIVRDMTEARQLEEALRHSQKMEAVGRLAGGIAHDFNNLLTVIAGNLEEARASVPGTHEATPLLVDAGAAADRASTLTSQLLAFSRRQIVSPRTFDLNEHLRELRRMLARLIGENIDFRLDLTRDPLPVEMDPGQLEQIVANLVVNARDAMSGGGVLLVRSARRTLAAPAVAQRPGVRPGDFAVLSVADDGEGMTDEVARRIFEPFFTTKPLGSGTGLGLPTVYGIAEQNGGFVEVESEPGAGASFHVWLPAAQPVAPVAPAEPPGPPPRSSAGRDRGAVLVAEDEPSVRRLVEKLLQRDGYTVYSASSAEEAIERYDGEQLAIDLLLTDVVMPGRSGPELARELTARQPGLPVVYMSGYTDDTVLAHGVAADEVTFLQKPFTRDELVEALDQALAAAGARAEA